MAKRKAFSIHWRGENNELHSLEVPEGWAEQEVSLLVDQINRGAFTLDNDSAIDLSQKAVDKR